MRAEPSINPGAMLGSGGKWLPSRDYDEEALGPAGEIHCTVEDWGKFLALQMGGPHPILDREHLNKLMEPVGFYAGGWGIIDGLEWAKGKAHTHNGSNGLWFATVLVAPGIDRAFVVVTNSRDFVGTRDLCAEMITTLKALDANTGKSNGGDNTAFANVGSNSQAEAAVPRGSIE